MYDTPSTYLHRTYPSGQFTALCLLDESWIRRRVEQIEFLGDDTVTGRVSVDLDVRCLNIDAEIERQVEAGIADLLVPVATLGKGRSLSSFDLRDGRGRALALPSRDLGAHLSVEALFAIVAPEVPPAHLEGMRGQIRSIVRSAPRPAKKQLGEVERSLMGSNNQFGEALSSSSQFGYLLRELAESYILFVPLAVDQRSARALIKFSYRQELIWDESLNLPQRFGWEDTVGEFNLHNAGFAHSYHVEVRVPDTVDITRAALTPIGRSETRRLAAETESAMVVLEGRTSVSHLSTHEGMRWEPYVLMLHLRPQRRGLVRSCSLAAWAACLTLVALVVKELGRANSVAAIADPIDIPTASAILVAVPLIVGAYALRPDEHPLVSRMYLCVRAATFAGCMASLAAVAAIALKFDGVVLVVMVAAALMICILSAIALDMSRSGNAVRGDLRLLVHGDEMASRPEIPRASRGVFLRAIIWAYRRWTTRYHPIIDWLNRKPQISLLSTSAEGDAPSWGHSDSDLDALRHQSLASLREKLGSNAMSSCPNGGPVAGDGLTRSKGGEPTHKESVCDGLEPDASLSTPMN